MRTLCVTPWFPNTCSDGRYSFIYRSVRALAAQGHDVRVLVTRPWVPRSLARLSADWAHAYGPLKAEEFNPLRVELVRYPSIPRYVLSEYSDSFYAAGVARRLQRMIREMDIQVVHAHTERAGIAAVDAARACGVASVVTLHGISTAPQLLDTPSKRKRLRDALNAAASVVLVGEPLRAYFAAVTGHDRNFRIVPNGFFLHGAVRARASIGSDVRFVSVANLEEGKGIDLNLEALARLESTGVTNWTYDVVGAGADQASLEKRAVRYQLASKVTFHGALPHNEAMRVLARGDVFILPSYREAFGIAYLEAMAAGLLTIGVAGQGPQAFIEQQGTGLLVEPRDVDSLYRAIRLAFDDPDRAAAVAEAGRRHVLREYTWERHAEKLSAVFRDALAAV